MKCGEKRAEIWMGWKTEGENARKRMNAIAEENHSIFQPKPQFLNSEGL